MIQRRRERYSFKSWQLRARWFMCIPKCVAFLLFVYDSQGSPPLIYRQIVVPLFGALRIFNRRTQCCLLFFHQNRFRGDLIRVR